MSISTQSDTRQQWLEERRTGVGGSDVAAILGLNPYESPYSVWADKLGLLPEREDTEAMRQGRDLEEYVAKRFCELSGKKVRRVNKMLRDPDHTFMVANIDRDIVGEDSGLECKTTSVMNLKKFKGGEFPEQYYCQCCHYLSVTGKARWYLAVLVLNAGFMVYQMTTIEGDDLPEWCDGSVYVEPDEFTAMIQAESEFWQLVENEMPPQIDGSEATKRALQAVNPMDEDKAAAILYGMEDVLDDLDSLKAQEKAIKAAIQERNNKLLAALGGATRGILRGHEVVLQTITKQPYTVNPKPYTQLRIKEMK